MTAIWAAPGRRRWNPRAALRHPVLHAALLSPGSARQAWAPIHPSQTGSPHTGQRSACSWHPADPPQSAQLRAIAPHSMAFSPVGSFSGMTETLQRNCLAGMGGNYTLAVNPVAAFIHPSGYASGIHIRLHWCLAGDLDCLDVD